MECQIRSARPEEIRPSLRTLLAREHQAAQQLDTLVDNFLNYVRTQGLNLDLHMVSRVDGRIVASCLAILSGGRAAMILIPSIRLFGRWKDQIVALLRSVIDAAPAHNLRLLQALTDPAEPCDERAFEEAGFRQLANLLYLERKVKPVAIARPSRDLQWITYSPQTHSLFASTVSRTYEGSLDCAELNGKRDIEDIIESHKATGIHIPQAWWIAIRDGEPLGVMLLAKVPQGATMEVVYMGVVPSARGTGIADALMYKALEAAGKSQCDAITLAVDENNAPARKYYARHRFRETGKRRAFIALINS
jgi:mycothiol synthase